MAIAPLYIKKRIIPPSASFRQLREKRFSIVKAPDYAIIGIKRHEETLIAYSKRVPEGTILYYEEVLNSKRNKSLRSKTIYKKAGTVSGETFLKLVTGNAHTDISAAKMVVGAGGNPGGEA